MASERACTGIIKITEDVTVATGQEVTISGFTTNTTYNGSYTVTDAGIGWFETGVAFTDDETGSFLVNGSSPTAISSVTDSNNIARFNYASPTTAVIAEVRSWSLIQTVEVLDASSMASCDKVKKVGMKDATGSITCLYDKTDTNGQWILNNDQELQVIIYPTGEEFDVGNKSATFNAIITSAGRTGSYEGLVESSFEFEVSGGVTWADLIS